MQREEIKEGRKANNEIGVGSDGGIYKITESQWGDIKL
jgi:hypothetical protein